MYLISPRALDYCLSLTGSPMFSLLVTLVILTLRLQGSSNCDLSIRGSKDTLSDQTG
jgi:hypothetical protein